jgi:hypothetical protein
MLRKLIPTVTVFALASVISTAASAQDTTRMQVGIVKPSYQVFVTAVNGTPATITALKARPAITAGDVTLVNLSDLSDGQPDSVIVVLLQPHTSEIEQLRTILGAQTEVVTVLKDQAPGLTVADVAAVGVQENGKLLVFYRPKGM